MKDSGFEVEEGFIDKIYTGHDTTQYGETPTVDYWADSANTSEVLWEDKEGQGFWGLHGQEFGDSDFIGIDEEGRLVVVREAPGTTDEDYDAFREYAEDILNIEKGGYVCSGRSDDDEVNPMEFLKMAKTVGATETELYVKETGEGYEMKHPLM